MPESSSMYLYVIIILIISAALIYLWKYKNSRKLSGSQHQYMMGAFELARTQFEIFNIKLQAKDSVRSGLAAMLVGVGKNGLQYEVGDFVPDDWKGQEVDVFFHVKRDEIPVSYAFSSKILHLKSDYEASLLLLALPQNLRVEKKRHFMRVKPGKDDVRVVGLWPLIPGKRLPETEEELGDPVKQARSGGGDALIDVENISGAGIALRIRPDKKGEFPLEAKKGAQLICLLVYSISAVETRNMAFWCTGEIMNVRHESGKVPTEVIGVEFTNWAILEQDQGGEIHWAHSSPSKGIKPILHWVEQIDKKRRKPA